MATISGIVRDTSNNPIGNILVRVYRRDTGALLGRTFSSDGVGDSSLASTQVNLRMWGYAGSQIFEDYSPTTKTVATLGEVFKSADVAFNEGLSARFDGNNDRLLISGTTAPGTGDYGMEGLLRRTGSTVSSVNNDTSLVDLRFSSTNNPLIYIDGADQSYRLVYFAGGADRIYGPPIAADTDYFWGLYRVSGVSRLFLQGVKVGSDYADTGNYNNTQVAVGGRYAAVTSDYRSLHGYVGSFRYKVGVGLYTADYTPPVDPFPTVSSALPLGGYAVDTGSYTGECTVSFCDAFGSPVLNDLVLRTTPV